MFGRFLDWFERHKFGVVGTLMLHTFMLFGMALTTFSCGVTVLWLHRAHIPGYVSLST